MSKYRRVRFLGTDRQVATVVMETSRSNQAAGSKPI